MSKIYPLEKSPLFRLRNRKNLAILLGLEERYFKFPHKYKYNEFEKTKANGNGVRRFAEPKGEIRKIQKSILKYLRRIETPDWLKSGKKGESYITNCKMHRNAQYIRTMDICHFYDAVSYKQIQKSFCQVFQMAPDISRLLTKLVTNNKVIPTGSPSSQLIVYWAYMKMFEEIDMISRYYGCKFSLYVDDMTFSSQRPIPRRLREDVVQILNSYGLHAKRSKDHYFALNEYKIVTGCGIKNGEIDVPNKLRNKIVKQYKLCQQGNDIKEIEKLNGMMCSARQIDPNIFPSVFNFLISNRKRLEAYSKQRYVKKTNLDIKTAKCCIKK